MNWCRQRRLAGRWQGGSSSAPLEVFDRLAGGGRSDRVSGSGACAGTGVAAMAVLSACPSGRWYMKLYSDESVPETTFISLHPLERPIRTNAGRVEP
jgi:hypothetical protein